MTTHTSSTAEERTETLWDRQRVSPEGTDSFERRKDKVLTSIFIPQELGRTEDFIALSTPEDTLVLLEPKKKMNPLQLRQYCEACNKLARELDDPRQELNHRVLVPLMSVVTYSGKQYILSETNRDSQAVSDVHIEYFKSIADQAIHFFRKRGVTIEETDLLGKDDAIQRYNNRSNCLGTMMFVAPGAFQLNELVKKIA